MKRVNTANLVPGMVTAEDVYNYNSQLILPKGLILDDKTITKLAFYSIISVRVEDEMATQETGAEEYNLSYSERLKKSEEFLRFKLEFEKDVEAFREIINEVVVKGSPLDVDKLLNQTLNIIDLSATTPNIFDMLHAMRDYDDATYVHSMNVALICNVFARWLHMDEKDVKLATVCGLMHDIGKTQISDSIIKKPGKLTAAEFKEIQRHPQKGYQFLKDSALDLEIKNAALMHHERCDGTGYPLGLTGNQITKFAKLVAIADVYDALTSARVYRGPLCPFSAISIFESEGLYHYDPQFIMTFLENVVNTYLLNDVILSNGVRGTIVFIHKEQLSRPTIKTASGFIDLTLHPDITIEALI